MRAHAVPLLLLLGATAACGGRTAAPTLAAAPGAGSNGRGPAATAIQRAALTAADVGPTFTPAADQSRGAVDPGVATGCGADLIRVTNTQDAANPLPYGYSVLVDSAGTVSVQSELDDLGTAQSAAAQNADAQRRTLACPTYAELNGGATAQVTDEAGSFMTPGAVGTVTTVTSGAASVVATYEGLAVGRYVLSVSIYAPGRAEARADALLAVLTRKAASLPR